MLLVLIRQLQRDTLRNLRKEEQNNNPVAGATVEGSWDTGISRSCVTNSIGQCTVNNNRVKPSITGTSFSVTGLAKSGYMYDPDRNVEHSILVSRP